MPYPHNQYLWFNHNYFSTNWGSVADWFQFVAVLGIGILAAWISWRQVKIQDFVEIFIRPNKLPNSKWELQIRNVSSRVIYIQKIEPEQDIQAFPNLKLSRNKLATLPSGENNYYSFPVPDPEEIHNEIRIYIYFEDHLGKKYKSYHVAWFESKNDMENGKWGMQNLKAERLYRKC